MTIDARFQLRRGTFELDVQLTVPSRGVSALFGRSGAGKTTVLRCLAGLERITGARLTIDGDVWQDDHRFIPTHKRPLGYVFQEPGLFPHLTVEGNLRFGQKRVQENERRVDFDDTVALLGIGEWLRRMPEALSAGQRQRVAIARALLTSPRLLLMDEPMASLDDESKQEILPWLERLHDNLAIPVVYVTHDLDEVARLADYMVLLDDGKVLAQGDLQTMLTRTDLPIARSDFASSVLIGIAVREDEEFHLTELQCGEGTLAVARTGLKVGDAARFRVLARDVMISLNEVSGISALNSLPATVLSISADPQPGHVLVSLDIGGQRLLSRITKRSAKQLALSEGTRIFALIKAVSVS